MNPFNGIERFALFTLTLQHILSFPNPFNGIESETSSLSLASNSPVRNPFNGIERAQTARRPRRNPGSRGIHSMELKEIS